MADSSAGYRRAGRLAAAQLLFALDQREALTPAEVDEAVANHFASFDADADERAQTFAAELCSGVVAALEQIDELLQRSSDNWRVERMSCVDRNVLRLATHELQSCLDVPKAVVVNEAVEIGKSLGDTTSGAFINGVLDRVLRELKR